MARVSLCSDWETVRKLYSGKFYHCTIEPLYTRGSVDLEDKSIMSRMLPGIRMVSNVLINTNGVFFDESDDVLSTDEAVRYLNNLDCDFIIKPSRETGGVWAFN